MTDDPSQQRQLNPYGHAYESTPVPDPTKLTTDAVDRAVAQWRRDLQSLRDMIEVRLDAMDRATSLRIETLLHIPDRINEEIGHLKATHDGDVRTLELQIGAQRELLLARLATVSDVTDRRFAAVDTRFDERDERTKQAADESRISLDAALAAAKEAVSEQNKANAQAILKSEIATQKQIDSMGAVMNTSIKSLEDKIGDAGRRLDRGEGHNAGIGDGWKLTVGIVGLLATIATIVAVAMALQPH